MRPIIPTTVSLFKLGVSGNKMSKHKCDHSKEGICIRNVMVVTSQHAEIYTHIVVFMCDSPLRFSREA